jgi:hypothetical protein
MEADIRSENAETEKKFFDDALTEIKVSSGRNGGINAPSIAD